MTIITNVSLDHNKVLKAIRHAQEIAKRNRCQSWNKSITIITGDDRDLRVHGNPHITVSNEMLGACWNQHPTQRCIYLKPDRPANDTILTLCHELAHAFTNPKASHSYSWRSLYLLYFATLPRIFDYEYDKWSFTDQIYYVRDRYEPRGYTPTRRHLEAMERMQKWYINDIEKDNV